jgi:hypothetical protein
VDDEYALLDVRLIVALSSLPGARCRPAITYPSKFQPLEVRAFHITSSLEQDQRIYLLSDSEGTEISTPEQGQIGIAGRRQLERTPT